EARLRIGRLADNREPCAISWTKTGITSGQRSLRYTRQSLDPFQHLPVIRSDLIWSIETFVRDRQMKRQHVVGLNAEIDPVEIPETFQRETTGRQQREGERKLRDYERTKSIALDATTAGPASQLENLIQIDSCCLPGRRSPKQKSSNCRYPDRKEQHRDADPDICFGRNHRADRRHHESYRIDNRAREKHTEGSTESRQHQALRKKLGKQPRSGGAQRRSYCSLFLTRGAARQQQIRHVDATNQEKKADRTQQQPEIASGRVSNEVEVQRFDAHTAIRI